MPSTRALYLVILTMITFAGNSLLCRLALKYTDIDAASFTSIRLISGALMLGLIVRFSAKTDGKRGRWSDALALFAYAACFSMAYTKLSAGTGALLLFGAVQITMLGYGLWRGERLRLLQWMGLLLALCGLTGLFLPGLARPPLLDSLLMLWAGVAWAIYSVLGKGVANPVQVTAGNFLRAVPFALGLSLIRYSSLNLDATGIGYAIASGAIASGMGYAIWYHALPGLKATQAATVQLSVPILAAIAAIPLLHEPMTLRLALAAILVLGGIALVIGPQGISRQVPADSSELVQPDGLFLTLSSHGRRKLVWVFWLITWLGLLAGLVWRQWYEAVVWFSAIHALLFIYLERFNLVAFPVQVRFAYVAWVAIGTYVPHMGLLMGIATLGLAANLFVGYCPLARMLSLLPINRSESLSCNLVKRVFISPPMQGRFIPARKL